jgi:hypothetical protein
MHEQGEYYFEADLDGHRIRSNTFIWRPDNTGEYLDDMPHQPFKLSLKPVIMPLTAIDVDPDERGHPLGYGPVMVIDKGDWIYYRADRNLNRIRLDGTGERVHLGRAW